jgi:hypothetical protein
MDLSTDKFKGISVSGGRKSQFGGRGVPLPSVKRADVGSGVPRCSFQLRRYQYKELRPYWIRGSPWQTLRIAEERRGTLWLFWLQLKSVERSEWEGSLFFRVPENSYTCERANPARILRRLTPTH